VTIGSETSGWIRNLVASNFTCNGTQMGIRIKSRRGRGGGVEDVRFDNWTMENVGTAVNVTNYYMMEGEVRTSGEQPVSARTPVFRNIAVSNVTANHARMAVDVEGLPEMPISGLRITNMVASSQTGVKAYNTDDFELHDVQVNAEKGLPFQIRDSKNLELDNVTTRKPAPGEPVIRLDHCPGAIVRNSRAFEGTDAFLSVGAGELKSVVLQGNALHQAKVPTEESAKEYKLTAESPTEKQ
jgi:polygalacturonase